MRDLMLQESGQKDSEKQRRNKKRDRNVLTVKNSVLKDSRREYGSVDLVRKNLPQGLIIYHLENKNK